MFSNMRTVSAKPRKGEERIRTLGDDLRLIRHILMMCLDYLIKGHRIRKAFYRGRKTREKRYVDDPGWLSP
jgi:hypothetical protein